MRSLTDIYPPFKDSVDLYAVAFNESLSDLLDYQQQSGHPGVVSIAVGAMLRDFEVTSQSTKVAIDGNGVIVYRANYGRGSPNEWRETLQRLADGAD